MFAKDSQFYNNPFFLERFLTIFIKGDRLILLPFFLILVPIFYISSNNSYRPFDFGLKNLSHNSIYILYQLTSTISATLFLSLLIYLLKYVH